MSHASDAAPEVEASGIPAPGDVASAPADAEKRPSGLISRRLQIGTGARHPTQDDYVELRYAGWRRDGRFFEGSGLGEPVRLDRAQVIPGLDEGLGLMVEGEKRRFWIPFALAYGARPNHVNAPQEDMTFDVELLKIVPIPPVPDDFGRPPKAATRTKSGLVYRFLKRGGGTAHPGSQSWVRVEQAMWTSPGRLFQSSRLLGDSVRLPVVALLPGVREAMLKMVAGDKLRLWLPGKLAFGDPIPGQDPLPFAAPLGPLVVDIELIAIQSGRSD